MEKLDFILNQLMAVAPITIKEDNYPEGFKVKVKSGEGETKWLQFTADEWLFIDSMIQEVTK